MVRQTLFRGANGDSCGDHHSRILQLGREIGFNFLLQCFQWGKKKILKNFETYFKNISPYGAIKILIIHVGKKNQQKLHCIYFKVSVLREIQLVESDYFIKRNSSLGVWKQSLSKRYTHTKYFIKYLGKALENLSSENDKQYCSVAKGNNSLFKESISWFST